jgi:hypothetical protein
VVKSVMRDGRAPDEVIDPGAFPARSQQEQAAMCEASRLPTPDWKARFDALARRHGLPDHDHVRQSLAIRATPETWLEALRGAAANPQPSPNQPKA